MKQRLTFYLITFLLAFPLFGSAQQFGKDSLSFVTGSYEVKKKKETIISIATKLNVDPQLLSILNDSTNIEKVLPVGKKVVIPVFSGSAVHSVVFADTVISSKPDTTVVTEVKKIDSTQIKQEKVAVLVPPQPAHEIQVDTDLIQNRILLTEATLDLNKALLQGIQASLDSLNVKDRSVIDEKNISLTIHRMQRQRDKAMLTPVLLHMQDSLKTEIKREEQEKLSYENMLSRNEPAVQRPAADTMPRAHLRDTISVTAISIRNDTLTKTENIQVPEKQDLTQNAVPVSKSGLKADSSEFLAEKVHIRPVVDANETTAPPVQAPVMHWETAKAIYFNDDTTGENQPAATDTVAYKPVVNESRSMSDSSKLIKAQYYYTRSLKASNEKNYKTAAEYLKKAIDIDPRYYNAWFALGEADAHLGYYTKAMNEFLHCKDLDSSKANLFYKMGVVQLKLKQKPEAFISFNRSLKVDSNYVPAIISRALEYADRGQFKTAIREYNKVLRLDPSYHTVYKSKAMAEYSLKNYSAAVDDFTRFLIFNETDGSVFYYRGMAKMKQNDLMDACTDLSISARLGNAAALRAMQANCK